VSFSSPITPSISLSLSLSLSYGKPQTRTTSTNPPTIPHKTLIHQNLPKKFQSSHHSEAHSATKILFPWRPALLLSLSLPPLTPGVLDFCENQTQKGKKKSGTKKSLQLSAENYPSSRDTTRGKAREERRGTPKQRRESIARELGYQGRKEGAMAKKRRERQKREREREEANKLQ